MNKELRIKNNSAGFTLLLASLIASLFLSVGLSMFTIAQKEIILSSLGRDSQYAFYAADTGAECALYWDFKDAFNPDSDAPFAGASCNGQAIGEPSVGDPTILVLGGGGYQAGVATTDFWFEQVVEQEVGGNTVERKRCINVTVTKRNNGGKSTEINSKGYSVGCDADGNPIINSRTLERAVRMKY